MKKVIAGFLVLLLCLVGLGLGLPPSMAAPTVVYDFLANASSATWTGWEATTSHPLTFGITSFTSGFAMNFSGTLEDGSSVSNAVEAYVPSVAPSGITGDWYHISIPAFAQLELVYGFKQGANATDGVEVGMAYAEDDPSKPVIELFKQSKAYDGTLGKATIDLSAYMGQVGGFQLFVRSGATATADALVWVKAVLSVSAPLITLKPATTVLIYHINDPTYTANGTVKTMDTSPVIVESRTFLPIRYVVEEIGGKVAWSAPDQKVTITFGSKTIELWIGNNRAIVDGKLDVPIDSTNSKVAPFIQPPGRTMMPLRFVSETLGCKVDWVPPGEVQVTYPAP